MLFRGLGEQPNDEVTKKASAPGSKLNRQMGKGFGPPTGDRVKGHKRSFQSSFACFSIIGTRCESLQLTTEQAGSGEQRTRNRLGQGNVNRRG
jgi:hypothetical protein